MIKVVILDDEYLVIEAMKNIIHWDKFYMEIVGTAMDGKRGFDLIVEKEPDVVLTDIRMPLLDGLSIIEKAKYIYPKMQFILFSGYTDFAYAQKAIVLGVLDYIVKPVTARKVESALEKALTRIDNSDAETIRQEIVGKLLEGGQVSEENWEKTEVSLAINEIRECLIMACSLPGKNLAVKEYTEVGLELKKYGVFYSAYPNMQVIMCLSSGVYGKEKMLAALQGAVHIWKKEEENCFIGYAYGQIIQTGIPRVYSQAKEALSYALFIGDHHMIDYQWMQANKRMPQNIHQYEKQLLEGVNENNSEKIAGCAERFFDECRQKHTEPNVIKHFILEFIYSALNMERTSSERLDSEAECDSVRLGTQINDIYECPPYLVVNQCANYQELLRWLTDELERIAGLLYDRGKGSRSQIVKVVEHIRTYYDRDLTLFELAEIAKMTPAYFSNVFKQETGTTYIKYLTKIRMEKAKELLLSGYKVADVSSMVGYENYRYFCVVFKKYTGVTAQQFKGRK